MKLRDLNEIRFGAEIGIDEKYCGDHKKAILASSLVEPVYGVMKFGSYSSKWNKKFLHEKIYNDAKRDSLVIERYREFKSGFGLLSFFAWPIFKMVLKWVIWYIINNYLMEE